MRKFLQAEGWGWQPDCGYVPPGVCFGGSEGSSQQSSQQSQQSLSAQQSATRPINFTPQAFQNEAGYTAATLQQLIEGLGSGGNAGLPEALGTVLNQATGGQDTNGSLVAPVTGAQNQTLSNLGAAEGGNFNFNPGIGAIIQQLQGEATNPIGFAQNTANGMPVDPSFSRFLDPNYAAGLATSPQTQSAIEAALGPTRQFFNAQTVPGLVGQSAAAGQRAPASSAFGAAFGNSLAQENASEQATAGGIANSVYQLGLGQEASAAGQVQGERSGLYGSGLNIAANAPGQISSLTSQEVSQLLSTLQAQALPQLTQQLGINNGMSQYQSAISSVMQALGLQVQSEAPNIGYESGSQSLSESSGQGTSQGSSQSLGFNFGALLP